MLDIVEKICYREFTEMKTITYFMRQKQKIKELQIMKKYLALVLSALILIGCLSACSSNEPAAKATDPVASAAPAAADSNADRVLNIGISSEISNIVPMSNNVAVANRDGLIVFALYDPLIWYDTTTDTLKPWIATEWSRSEDGKEWYFTLRDDVYFHNGDKMTAEDVAWSLNLIPENPVVTDANIPGYGHAEVVDDTHVTVYMDTPFAATENFFASYHMVMLDKSYQEEVGWEGYIDHPIGTGPYKFVDRALGAYVKMDANEQYWQGAPDIKHINLNILPDANSQLLSLEAGEVDVLQNVSLANCEKVEAMDGFTVDYCVAKTVAFINWGANSKLDTDENLRKAVACAINYDSICNVLNKGHTVPVTCMIAPGIHCRPADGTFTAALSYDPDAAKEYLAQSTYTDADVLSIVVTAGAKEESICKVIQGNLNEVGINAELKAIDGATYSTLIGEGNFDIGIYSTLPSLYDCNLMYQFYIPGTALFDKSKCEQKEELGALAIASLTEMDEEARTDIFRQMCNIMNEHAVKLPLYQDCNTFCFNGSVTNVHAIPGTNVRVAEWSWAK